MIVNVPAYDSSYFIKNGLVWGAFRGQLKAVQIVFDTSFIIGINGVTKNALILTPEQYSAWILFRPWLVRVGKVLPESSAYTKTIWQRTFDLPDKNVQFAEAKDLDNTYLSTAPFTAKNNGVGYVAQDNPIVDFHVFDISTKEPDYAFIPVGGHVG